MTPDLDWMEWPAQQPSSTFVDSVVQPAPIRDVGRREWVPQRPSRGFAFIATAQIAQMASKETQQMRIGMRAVRAIFGEDTCADLFAEPDAAKGDDSVVLLAHTFLRWAQNGARQVLGVAALVAADEQAARSLAIDAVRQSGSGMALRAGKNPLLARNIVERLEERIRRRAAASASEFRRFVHWSMRPAFEVALHLVPAEEMGHRVVRRAFLFFLDGAAGVPIDRTA